MSDFQKRLLADVGGLYRRLYEEHQRRARAKARISQKARRDILILLVDFDRLRALTPFPQEAEVDQSPLEQLRRALDDPSSSPEDNERALQNWVRQFVPPLPAPDAAMTSAPPPVVTPEISPINQRMLEATRQLRSAIDRSRTRLLKSDPYDFPAYRAARNEYTLARATYDQRLKDGTASATVEDAARMERVLTPAVATATGAAFPGTISDAANFLRDLIFALA